MSDPAEALARVLWGNGNPGTDLSPGGYTAQAEAILADPAPLLDALAEAGVLDWIARQAQFGEVRDVYATEWRPTDG